MNRQGLRFVSLNRDGNVGQASRLPSAEGAPRPDRFAVGTGETPALLFGSRRDQSLHSVVRAMRNGAESVIEETKSIETISVSGWGFSQVLL